MSYCHECGEHPGGGHTDWCVTGELERLRAKVAELEEQLGRAYLPPDGRHWSELPNGKRIAGLEAEVIETQRGSDRAWEDRNHYCNDNAALRTENARLREALEQAADMNDWGASAICRAALEVKP